MSNNTNNDKEKTFYSIGEVSQMLGIPTSTLRYWEKELPTINPRKSQGGTRKYHISDIEELKLIHRLVKDEGHTIEGAKKILRRRRHSEMTKSDIIRRLQDIRQEIMGILQELEENM
ncbi:MAG: MerR family transcriptional regulator [Bacteroidaceae bacterium]|nr:MerR family transcriptional regulator [Bacteroidaceae bacterium]